MIKIRHLVTLFGIFFLFPVVFPFLAHAGDPVPVRLAYVPNMAFAPAFVIKGEGWDRAENIDLQLQKFPAAPFALQAFMAGQLDMMYTILSSVMALGEKGRDIRVVAGATRNQLVLYSVPELAELKNRLGPVEAIRRFTAENGRKPKVLLFSRGIMSDILFRKWVMDHPTMRLDDFEITNIAGQDQFLQAAVSGDYDLYSIYEPVISIAKSRNKAIEVFLSADEFMKNHPVAVLATSQDYITRNPDIVRRMIALNKRASDFIRQNPERAAQHVAEYIVKGALDQTAITAIVTRARDQYDTDLDAIEWPSREIVNYLLADKMIDQPIDFQQLFYRPQSDTP